MDRIDDFRATPSAQLTVEQFHLHDFDIEYDPPAYTKNTKKDKDKGKYKDKDIKDKDKNDNDSDSNGDDDSDIDPLENNTDGEVYIVDGVRVRKCVIRGIEVHVPLPQDKKKRLDYFTFLHFVLLSFILSGILTSIGQYLKLPLKMKIRVIIS